MLLSLNWLQNHVDLGPRSPEELADLFTFAGIEVEGIDRTGVPDQIVVAQITAASPHPDADRLKVCTVDAGQPAPLQIVCGAQNYAVGDKIPCALPGATLPSGLTIKVGKLRGVESQGMLCSASELGLPPAEDGLLILPPSLATGTPLSQLFPADTIFDLEITPNRPDCLSHRGLAREMAALLATPLAGEIPTSPDPLPASAAQISLADPAACPLYSARIIRGITVADSPPWLQQRLAAVGLRPINNVVDITNFVLMELGQPLHAFDLAKLALPLTIRRANPGESLLALDGLSYPLSTQELVIADAASPLAIAGIMGGEPSSVTTTTTDILLESAYFDPPTIRRSSRQLGLSSDSSYRFERGVDPSAILAASQLATQLIVELAGGSPEPRPLVAGSTPQLTGTVPLDLDAALHFLGDTPSQERAIAILTSLGLTLTPAGWTIPPHRADLQRPADLVEEIARVHGLDNIPARLAAQPAPASPQDAAHDFLERTLDHLAAIGFDEVRTLKLTSPSQLANLPHADAAPALKNPLSEDLTHLRPSLIPGLLATLALNLRMGAQRHAYAEAGTTFSSSPKTDAPPAETQRLALLLSGPRHAASWARPRPDALDFHDLRAALAQICPHPQLDLDPAAAPTPGLALATTILIGRRPIGIAGQLSPSAARKAGTAMPVLVAELDLAALQQSLSRQARFSPLPRFPASSRDVALDAPADLPARDLATFFSRLDQPLLVGVELFDVFSDPSGEKLASGRRSLAYSLTYRSPERTLEADEVDRAHAAVLSELTSTFPVTVR
jgi:phenylalanyl-tRNA synthetase beta chain